MPRRRLIFIALVALAGLLVASCGGGAESSDTPAGDESAATSSTTTVAPSGGGEDLVITDGDIVEVHYVGTLDDGSVFDSSRDRGETFTFTVGSGDVIAGFDEAVRGAGVGDVKTVRIEPADAYGEWSEDNVIEVPFNPEQGDVKVGDQVYLTNGQPAVVLEVTDETVTLDANNPLVGEALTFEIEIISVTRG